MAWWLQGDLQPFAHFRSGDGAQPWRLRRSRRSGRRPRKPPAGRWAAPVLTLCRGWVRGREQSEANEKWAACERATRR